MTEINLALLKFQALHFEIMDSIVIVAAVVCKFILCIT